MTAGLIAGILAAFANHKVEETSCIGRVVKEEYKSHQTPQLKKRQQSYLNLKLVNFSRRTSQKIRT
jgi:hypothetical protein